MNEHAFIFGGRRYHITSQFDAGSALSAARRLRVLASYLDDGAPMRDAVALFEHAARHVAIAQLDALPVDYCGTA